LEVALPHVWESCHNGQNDNISEDGMNSFDIGENSDNVIVESIKYKYGCADKAG